MKQKKLRLLGLFTLAGLFMFACNMNIGLGSAVDTESPVLEITSPSAGDIIRDKFAIKGTWSDDGQIETVTVNLKSISSSSTTENNTNVSYTATVTGNNPTEDKEWNIVIDPFANNIADGDYVATVVIEDKGKHKTTATCQFTVDNTPPVIVLQRPGTDFNASIDNADSYGQTLTLEGQAADDNNINHIDINFYDDVERLRLRHTVTLNNVPLSIALDVAKWGSEDYSKIYNPDFDSDGNPIIGGAKQFYCEIKAYDSAQRFPIDGTNQNVEDLKGNCTSTFYLYEEISSSILTEYKITDIYHMMAGTYKSSDSRSASDIATKVQNILNQKKKEAGTFVLNPTNNPTFMVNGKDSLVKNGLNLTTNENYWVTNNSDVIVEVSPGLDNSPLVKDDSFKVYVEECNIDGTVKPNASRIYLTEKTLNKSGSKYKFTVTVGNSVGLVVGKCYLFGVGGKDEAGNEIISSNNGYGMYLAPSGNAPELKVSEPSESMIYVKKDGTLTISGYTVVESGAPELVISNGADIWRTIVFEESQKDPTYAEKNKYKFSITFDNDFIQEKANKRNNNEADSTDFSLTINSSQSGKGTSVYKTVMYDVDGPVISITNDNISPAIESYIGATGAGDDGKRVDDDLVYSNGIISVSGTLTDEFANVADYKWSVLQDNEAVDGFGGTVTKSSKINFSFDTLTLSDKTKTTVVIEATDVAGNKTTKNLPFFLDQQTDKPTFEAQDGVSWKLGVLNPNYIIAHSADNDPDRTNILSGDLYSKLCDDDGVAKVVFTVKTIDKSSDTEIEPSDTEKTKRYNYRANDTLAGDATYTNKEYLKSGTEASVSQKMPSKPGFYEITQTLYDKYYDESDPNKDNHVRTATYIVKVQGSGPQVSLQRDSKFVKTSDKNNKLKVKIKIDQGEAPYTIQRKVAKGGGEYQTFTVATNVMDYSSQTAGEKLDAENYYEDEFSIDGIDFSTDLDVTYIVTDVNGATEKDLDYTVDNNPPVSLSIDNPKDDSSAVGYNALNGADAGIRGTAKDTTGESGMKSIWYAITDASASEPNWSDVASYKVLDVGDGTWNLPVYFKDEHNTNPEPFLDEGSYKLWVKAVDAAGNVTTSSVSRVFDVDQASPVIENVKLTYTNESNEETVVPINNANTLFFKSLTGKFKISGTVKETNGIREVGGVKQIFINNEAPTSISGPDTYGVYSWTKNIDYLADTLIPVDVIVSDNVNRTTTLEYSIYCDTTAPVLEMTNPDYSTDITGKNALSKSKETFRANVNDGNGSGKETFKYLFTKTKIGNNTDAEIIASAKGVEWTLVTGSDIADERKLVTSAVADDELSEGSWYFYVYAADKMGNESVLYKPFWIDLYDPVLTVEELKTPTNSDVVLKGSASDNNSITSVIVEIDDKVLAYDSQNSKYILSADKTTAKNIETSLKSAAGLTLPVGRDGTGGLLSEGSHTIKVTATDGAEKTTVVTQTIFVDTIKPAGGVIETGTYAAQTPITLNGKNWFNNSAYTVKIKDSSITESGSKIDTVETLIIKDGDSIPSGFTGSQTLKKSQPDSADKETIDGKTDAAYKWTGKTEIPEQGPNDIYIKVTDKAGNEYVSSSLGVIYLDNLAPTTESLKVYEKATQEEITADLAKEIADRTLVNVGSTESGKEYYVKEITGTKIVNGKAPIEVFVTASDDVSKVPIGKSASDYTSGIKTIEYQYGAAKLSPDTVQKITLTESTKVDVKSGFYKITIPANTAQTKYQNGAAKFIATDNVGNACSAVTAFTFELDVKDPEVSIDEIKDADDSTTAIDVNRNFVLTGKATDESGVGSISITYLVDSSASTPSTWTGATTDTIANANPWSYTFDTTSFADTKYLHIKVEVKDVAQNTKTSDVQTVYINQDSDRPIINFTNLDLSTKDTGIWLTGTKLFSGVVTDDDGSISTGVVNGGLPESGFCYIDKKAETPAWTPITVLSNGAWKFNVEDGSHEFCFYIKDSNGNVFQTDETTIDAAKNLNQPKLKSESETDSYWIAKKPGVNESFENAKVSFKVDTKAPIPSQIKFSNVTPAENINAEDWKGDQTTLVFGGTYNRFSIRLDVQDNNGIKYVKTVFNDTVYDAVITTGKNETEAQAKNSPEKHEWIFKDIPIPSTYNGNKEIVIYIWDNSNDEPIITPVRNFDSAGKSETVSITVDNTPPQIGFSNYKDDEHVFATSSINIRGSESAGNLADWYYLITDSTATQPKSAITKTLKAGANAGSSFSVVFDTIGDSNTEIKDKSLFDYILSLEGKTKEQLESEDTIRTLYMWVWGKDVAGNESDPISLRLKVIPNGDKPSVTYGYPSESGISLGGIVRLTGTTAIQTDSVDKVFVQIDPLPFTAIAAGDLATFTGKKYYKYTFNSKEHYAEDDGKLYKQVVNAEETTYEEAADGTFVKNGNGYFAKPTTFYKLGFTSDWKTHLTTAASGKSKTLEQCGYKVELTGKADTGLTEAIKANGITSSWNLTLNSYEELNDYDFIAVRTFAISTTKSKISESVDTWFKMDPNSPQIGSNPQLKLVQYDSPANVGKADHVIRSQAYVNDMWISGQWYLVGSVTDDSGIKRISYKEGSGSVIDLVKITDADNNIGGIDASDTTHAGWVVKGDAKGSNFNYNLCIPVGDTTANAFGSLSYTITAYEGTGQNLSTTQTITLKYDNQSPQFALTTSEVESKETAAEKLALEITSSATTPIQIVQSNKTYTMYGVFDEASGTNSSGEDVAQSGFKRVAFYFTRDIGGVKYLIDPMLTNDDSSHNGRANFIVASGDSTAFEAYKAVSASGDGLYWLKTVSGTITENSKITLTSIPDYVRLGGLVKVDGIIYQISKINYTEKSVSVDGTLTNGAGIDVNFAVAQVVDHLTRESGTTKVYNKTTPLATTAYDDGDQMIETVTSSGSTYTWSASIDSSLILDGPVTMHFVAFDNAGNATEKSYTGVVKNNAPRLYGVKYGTDINGDGAIFGSEWVTTESQKYSVLAEGGSTEDTSDDVWAYGYDQDTSHPVSEYTVPRTLTVKGLTRVIPQIVGGNNGLGYTYTKDGAQQVITQYTGVGHDASGNPRTDNLGIVLTVDDFLGFSTNSQTITFKVWDYTDGTTYDSATAVNRSNVATINIPVDIQVADVTKPIAFFKPFHWNSASDNSLYGNKSTYGHIELENDWKNASGYSATATNGTADGDPKISGKVTFDGVATDNVIVQEIYITIPGYNSGNAVKIAERNSSGAWSSTNILENTNAALGTDWAFQLVSDIYDSDGKNTVKFKFHFDTEKITNVADTDVSIVVSAKDRGKATAVTGTTDKILSTTWGNVKNDDDVAWYTDAEATTTKATSSTTDSTTVYHKFSVESITLIKNTSSAASAVEECTWADVKADNTTTYYTTKGANNALSNAATSSTEDTATVYASRSKTYKVDVVPYINKVTTGLSSLKTKTPSVYNRTALGHYGVKSTETISIEGFNLGSSATITDENANTATVSSGSVAVGSLTSGKWTLSVNSVNAINNVNNNNANGSTQGTKTIKTASEEELNYFYNSKANKDNNNKLTDDLVFDVWQITEQAAKPRKGGLLEPVMKVNPVTDKVGFAFVNGSDAFSMADDSYSYRWFQYNYADYRYVSFAYDDLGNAWGTAAGLDTEPSYPLAGRFSLFSSLWKSDISTTDKDANYKGKGALRIDSMGIPTGVIAQGDPVGSGYPDTYRFRSPSIATSIHTDSDGNRNTSVYLAYVDVIQGQIRLRMGEQKTQNALAQKNNTDYEFTAATDGKTVTYTVTKTASWNQNDPTYESDFIRGRYILIGGKYIECISKNVTYTSATRPNWYDDKRFTFTDEIELSEEVTQGSYTSKLYEEAKNTTKATFGDFNDNSGYYYKESTLKSGSLATSGNDSKLAYEVNHDNFTLIAGKDYQNEIGTDPETSKTLYYDTGYTTGEYVAIGVIPGASKADDVLVAVWYDGKDCYYSYVKNPFAENDMGNNSSATPATGYWRTPVKIFAEGGEHCTLAVDAKGGVHIAAAVSGSLKYAYLPSYSASYTESANAVVVDSYDTTGERVSIDTYLTTVNEKETAIPVISYYMSAKEGRAKLATIAIPESGDISYTLAGVNESSEFTGDWEVKIVPNTGKLQNDRVSVGVWKETSGAKKGYWKSTIATGTTTAGDSNGSAYGNGTQNVILGYATRSGANYQIETAQMK